MSKFALVIANSEYIDPGLAKLTAPGQDAEDFARVLKSTNIGQFDDVNILFNQSESVVREAVDRFFQQKKADDLLVLYFSGHGVRDEQGVLYLAVRNTDRNLLRSTAIKSDFIRESMDQSHSRRQVLILDCCNSGAFAQGTKSAVGGSIGTSSAFEGTGYGRVVLTATDATQYAWEGEKIIGKTETKNSLFTHFLIKGLEGGADQDGNGTISVDELYDYTYEQIVSRTPSQTPGKWSYKQQGEIILRQGRPEDIKPVDLSADWQTAIKSVYPTVREAAVHQLEELFNGSDTAISRSARTALEIIATNDDSRRVAQAAALVLQPVLRAEYDANHLVSDQATRELAEQQKADLTQHAEGISADAHEFEREQQQADISLQADAASTVTLVRPVNRPPQKQPTPLWLIVVPLMFLLLIGCIFGMWGLSAIASKMAAVKIIATKTLTLTLSVTAKGTPAPHSTPTPLSSRMPTVSRTPVETATPELIRDSVITRDKDAMLMIYVSQGPFSMGSDTGEANEKPVHTISLDAFWIDKTEVTQAMFEKFVQATKYQTDAEKAGKSFVINPNPLNWQEIIGADWRHPQGPNSNPVKISTQPVVQVSWNDASAYCDWAGARLPDEAEWEKAARGEDGRTYPWGDSSPNGRLLNYADVNLVVDWANKNVDDGYLFTAPVGSYPAGASPYGVLDMAGNVYEWVADWYNVYPGGDQKESPDFGKKFRVLRGGSWYLSDYLVRAAYRGWNEPATTNNSFGFRCAR